LEKQVAALANDQRHFKEELRAELAFKEEQDRLRAELGFKQYLSTSFEKYCKQLPSRSTLRVTRDTRYHFYLL
jgi:hypothetical protein